jgi:hypothetical protein
MSYLQFLLGLVIVVLGVFCAPTSFGGAVLMITVGFALIYRHLWREVTGE